MGVPSETPVGVRLVRRAVIPGVQSVEAAGELSAGDHSPVRSVEAASRSGFDESGGHVQDEGRVDATTSIVDAIARSSDEQHVPVTFECCDHVEGPFFHGTKTAFEVSDRVIPGSPSNYHEGRISNHVYFAALLEPAVWAAELAVAHAGSEERGRIFIVEPTGPFEDDPNVTNKKFPGNVTRSYRTRHPMRVIREVETWDGHAPEVLQGMLDNLAHLRDQGLDVIED